MLSRVTAGWSDGKGKDELDAQITLVPNDPPDHDHLMSLLGDDWTITPAVDGGTLVLNIHAMRKVPLAEQAAAKAQADEAAAKQREAEEQKIREANAAQALKDERVQKIASAAAKSAVEAALAAEN